MAQEVALQPWLHHQQRTGHLDVVQVVQQDEPQRQH